MSALPPPNKDRTGILAALDRVVAAIVFSTILVLICGIIVEIGSR